VQLLSKPEFINRKLHDSLVIFGTGYSINFLSENQWHVIDTEYDTFGMGWYCKMKRPTTWYMVREQCSTQSRIDEEHSLDVFYSCMEHYRPSVKLVKDMSYRKNNFQHILNLHKFDGAGHVFNEIYGGCSAKSMMRTDIFDEGICHGKCSMYDALHFAMGMGYKKLLFCGVDLYDSRCFYKGYDDTLKFVLREGRTCATPHRTAENTRSLIKKAFVAWDGEMMVHHKRSLLADIIPLWEVI
jgi:hypothetical protein